MSSDDSWGRSRTAPLVGGLLILAGCCYLGLFTGDPTRPDRWAILLALPVFSAAIQAFRRSRAEAVLFFSIYALLMPYVAVGVAAFGHRQFAVVPSVIGVLASFVAVFLIPRPELSSGDRDPAA